MAFVKVISNGYIIGVGQNKSESGGITEQEYDSLTAIFNEQPKAEPGYKMMLNADTLSWDAVPIPPPQDDDIPAEEALDIMMGVSE